MLAVLGGRPINAKKLAIYWLRPIIAKKTLYWRRSTNAIKIGYSLLLFTCNHFPGVPPWLHCLIEHFWTSTSRSFSLPPHISSRQNLSQQIHCSCVLFFQYLERAKWFIINFYIKEVYFSQNSHFNFPINKKNNSINWKWITVWFSFSAPFSFSLVKSIAPLKYWRTRSGRWLLMLWAFVSFLVFLAFLATSRRSWRFRRGESGRRSRLYGQCKLLCCCSGQYTEIMSASKSGT